LFKKYTVTLGPCSSDNENVSTEKGPCLRQPIVKFELVRRKLSPIQAEAGRRLFKKLVARAQSKAGSGGRG
jgi:hypothetical protein